MGIFFIYILKSAACLSLLYLFYRLMLSKETFYRFNRIALLGILFLSLLVPCVEVTTSQQTEVGQTMLAVEQVWAMKEEVAPSEVMVFVSRTISWVQILLLVYWAGILFFLFRSLYSLSSLLLLIKSGKREKFVKGVTLIVHERHIAPFSWMRYIVVSREDLKESGREILIHEMAHIRNHHSVDLLITDICVSFQWFNPGAWLLKQELQNIHEYEADETVIRKGVNAREYQQLLIKKAVGTRLYSMANSFTHSKLKKRITMMLKEKSNPWARLKYLYVLPLATMAVTAFARPEISQKTEEISAFKVSDLTAIVETKIEKITKSTSFAVWEDTLKNIQRKEELNGDSIFGYWSLSERNCNYEVKFIGSLNENPDNDGKRKFDLKRISLYEYPGNPLIFVDGKEISITEFSSVLYELQIKSYSAIAGKDAVAVYGEKGRNGVLDIQLKQNEEGHKVIDGSGTRNKILTLDNLKSSGILKADDGRALVIIDGKEAVADKFLEEISIEQIKNFSVLKAEEATSVYGNRGKNGVVMIELYTKEESAARKK